MTTRIAFLRAVNVGKRTVPMARLAEVVAGLGHRDVWTFINSGNVVFDAGGRRGAIESELEAAFEAEFGFEVTTFVRTATELRRILAVEPFEVGDGDTYLVTFLKAAPSAELAAAVEGWSNSYDTLVVDGTEVHWRLHGRSSDTTLTKAQWNQLGAFGSTSRNVTALRRLAAKIADQ